MKVKRGGWKGRKIEGGKAKTPDTRVKGNRPRQYWANEDGTSAASKGAKNAIAFRE